MMTYVWCIVLVITLVVELVTAGTLVSIWFAIGGLAALLLALFNVHFIVQIIVFAAVSCICMLLFRPLATQMLRGNIQATNADRLIGKHLRLTKEITENTWGEVSVNGTTWSCASYNDSPIAAQKMVTVLAIEGAKLIVKEID